jgi:hypothetical protein
MNRLLIGCVIVLCCVWVTCSIIECHRDVKTSLDYMNKEKVAEIKRQ